LAALNVRLTRIGEDGDNDPDLASLRCNRLA
jgi:hypothetical protein